MPFSFWRSSEAMEQLNRLDRAGFAVEFLRRNAGYRRDYARTLRQIAGGVEPDAARFGLARRWGLSFCPRPGLTSRESDGSVATGGFARHDDHRACATRL